MHLVVQVSIYRQKYLWTFPTSANIIEKKIVGLPDYFEHFLSVSIHLTTWCPSKPIQRSTWTDTKALPHWERCCIRDLSVVKVSSASHPTRTHRATLDRATRETEENKQALTTPLRWHLLHTYNRAVSLARRHRPWLPTFSSHNVASFLSTDGAVIIITGAARYFTRQRDYAEVSHYSDVWNLWLSLCQAALAITSLRRAVPSPKMKRSQIATCPKQAVIGHLTVKSQNTDPNYCNYNV